MIYSMKVVQIALYLFFTLSFFNALQAQRGYDLYWISFKDKNNSPYSLFHPQEYLSADAIERRQRQGIALDSTDLPVNPQYIEEILVQSKAELHLESKWLNGVGLKVENEQQATDLLKLSFVRSVKAIGFTRKRMYPKTGIGAREYKDKYRKRKRYYGDAWIQIKMLNGHYLHRMGYKGTAMKIAILDAGFEYLKETPAFDSLIAREGILGTRDFVENDDFVLESSNHGRNVLATIAGNLPYLYVGTAPQALFYLLKTEDELGEYTAEEYNWLVAVEYADQLGVDVINSSLGYYKFDDQDMNYAYDDLDGNTTIITRAADYAAQKGILVVNSTGNEGNNKWKYITAPGDGDSVLTVGAVDREGVHAKFSSKGFAQHHILKPDVMARGHTAVIPTQYRYNTQYTFGTSFSCPIMAGTVTTLWQAVPYASNMDIVQTLQRCGHQYNHPDTMMGYGIPNVLSAYHQLTGSVVNIDKKKAIYHHESAIKDKIDIFIPKSDYSKIQVHVFDAYGQKIHSRSLKAKLKDLWHYRISEFKNYPAGTYSIAIEYGKFIYRILVIK